MEIILASNSPRRKEILENVGVKFQIKVSGAEEKSDADDPVQYVKDIAGCKGDAVYKSLCASEGKECTDEKMIISADTVVLCDNQIMGKPKNRTDAIAMLTSLSGREHKVVTAIAVKYKGKTIVTNEVTKVIFDSLTKEQIEKYADTDEPYDKAGGYAIQGLSSKFVKKIDGCYFNVVGLPIYRLYKTVREYFGIELY